MQRHDQTDLPVPAARAAASISRLVLVVLLCLPAVLACSAGGPASPQARAGLLDLSGWDFARMGSVSLDGEYDFWWHQLLSPPELAGTPPLPPSRTVLPNYWNTDGSLPANGYATYRLRVRLPQPATLIGQSGAQPVYALKITEILTAFQVWVDGVSLYRNGQVGTDEASSQAEYRPGVVYFSPAGEWTDIVIQVSNFHYRKGGIWTTFELGNPELISGSWYRNSHLNLFLIGCLVIMGLYHLGIYFLRKIDRSALWFAAFCFVVMMRLISTGDQLLSQWIPGFSWEIARKFEYLPLNIGSVFFMFFITTLFRKEVVRWQLVGMAGLAGALGLAVLVLPTAISNNLVLPMQIYIGLAFAWILVVIVQAVIKKREGAALVLAGSLILLVTVANDMLYANQVIRTGYFMPLGFFAFIFVQAFILAMKFSRSFQKAEFLGAALADTNQALRRFVPYEFLDFLHKNSIVDVQLGDQVQKEMSILFSDIRSFTSLSERLSPKENFNFLNSYLERIGPVIRANGGFIDKYLGDGIMALFPVCLDDALAAGVAMQEKVREYNVHRAKSGYDPITIGIAINVGHLMLGTIGEADRMDTTVISDAVNLASRMEGLSKIYGPGIIVTEAAIAGLSEPGAWRWRRLGRSRVRGRAEAISLVQVLDGLEPELVSDLMAGDREWESGLDAYARGELGQAEAIFLALHQRTPGDPAIEVYLRRCRSWQARGLPANWDGIESWSEISSSDLN